jgi:hypothetical protein
MLPLVITSSIKVGSFANRYEGVGDSARHIIIERIPCVTLKVIKILDLPLEKLSSLTCQYFKISHPPMPLP